MRKLHFGLKYLNFNGLNFGTTSFKVKTMEIQNKPEWPELVKFVAASDLSMLDLSKSQMTSQNIELVACSIGKNPISKCQHLKILNLANNKITQVGAKILSPALGANKSIEFLDLSQNQLGVYGGKLIASAFLDNQVLKGLNLFKNSLDVDGARALRDLLKVNHSIEFLDIGHNRIRSKGLEAISQGILESENSKLKTLGLRMNFINDNGFTRFFDEVIHSEQSHIENLYISQNNLSNYKATKLQSRLKEDNIKIYVDSFENLMYQTEERMSKTLWFGPIDPSFYGSAKSKLQMIDKFRVYRTGLYKQPLQFKCAKNIPGRKK